MLVVVLTANAERRAHWFSLWYEGADYRECIPDLRRKSAEQGLRFSQCYPVNPPMPSANALLNELHARHGQTFRTLCIHVFALGYTMGRNEVLHASYARDMPRPSDVEASRLLDTLWQDEQARSLLTLIMTFGTACELHDRIA